MKTSAVAAFLASFLSLSSAAPVEQVSEQSPEKRATSNWFLPNLDHTSGAVRGYVPDLYGSNGQQDYTYPVYEAANAGDAQSFINSLYDNGPSGSRDNGWIAGEPRVVYLPPGTYTLSQTVYLDTDTVIIGDANNPPTIKAAANFNGPFMIGGGAGNDSPTRGGESHFSVSIRNVILDTTAYTGNSSFIALHWRVAQNSALNNIQINLPHQAHTGIYMGQGSTTSVGDVSFSYGNIGLWYDGHQQAQLKNLQFTDSTTGIRIDNGFMVSVLAPKCNTVGNCIVLNSAGSSLPYVSVVDGVSQNSGDFFTSHVAYPSFVLENIKKDNTNTNMVVVNGQTKVGGVTSLGTYIYGNVYNGGSRATYVSNPTASTVARPTQLAPGGSYPIISAPQYQGKTTADVVNLKDANQNGGFTLHGDGSTDDTAALQGAFNTAAGKIGYLPFGIYKVTSTITIPSGSQIYGEGWSTISGYGNYFSDESNPKPVVQIGKPNSSGTAVVQDMRFTVGQMLPGAIILQVNLAGSTPGDVAVHNSLITVGGTRDTSLSCTSEANCRGAYLGLHLAPGSTAYIDNFWSWLADHASDNSGGKTNIAAKGGVLVESKAATWLVGLASEHWWLYNLGYSGAQNVFTSFYQSETNYRQGNGAAATPPAPFTPTSADLSFNYCNGDASCAMTAGEYYGNNPSNIFHYAGGSWNFASTQQQNMFVFTSQAGNSHLHGYNDHAAKYAVRLSSGKQFGNMGNDGYGGSWDTLVADIAQQT